MLPLTSHDDDHDAVADEVEVTAYVVIGDDGTRRSLWCP
jgi:hypothetical protein